MSGQKKATPKAAPAEEPESQPESQPSEPQQPAGPSQASQATAAATAAVSTVREKLVAGEQIALVSAGMIVIVYVVWQFLLDYRIFIDSFTVILAVFMILAIWIHRWGHYDFGSAYRITIGGLGVALALFALMNLLAWARGGGDSVDFMHLLGRAIYWISGVGAFYGGWQVFRVREDS